MPRKKKEPIELIEDSLESESLEDTDEVEEIDLAQETASEDSAAEAELSAAEEKSKRRRERRKAAPKSEDERDESIETESGEPMVSESAAPIAVRKSSKSDLSPDPRDPMIRQWEMLRDISEAICVNLERVHSQLREMPAQYAAAFQDSFRPPIAKPAPVTKIAVLVAGLSLVLSVLSLSFSQSVRNSVLSREMIIAKDSRRTAERTQQAPPAAAPAAQIPATSLETEIARIDNPKPREQTTKRIEPKAEVATPPTKRNKKASYNRHRPLPHQFE